MAAKNSEAAPLSPVEARVALANLGISYDAQAFLSWAGRGDLVVVKLFVEAGMSVDTVFRGMTALHTAAEDGNLEIVKYLVGQKARRAAKDDEGSTALHTAALWGRLSVVQYLVEEKKASIKARNKRGWTALHTAAAGGNLEVVKYLVGQGAAVNATDKEGKTPRDLAQYGGLNGLKVFRYLRSLDDDESNRRGDRPFYGIRF